MRILQVLITRVCVLTLYAAADVGSVYEPAPTLTYTWDPDERAPKAAQRSTSIRHRHGRSFDLGPHPADPSAMSYAPPLQEATSMDGPRSQARQAIGQEIWVYEGNGGCVHIYTFVLIVLIASQDVDLLALHHRDPVERERSPSAVQRQQWARYHIPRSRALRYHASSCLLGKLLVNGAYACSDLVTSV